MADLAQLLFRGESESLDFKREAYPFANADDNTKSEILKDILAMANSWRQEDAHILLGVDAGQSPVSVVGIQNHVDDAALQQFVAGKTQRPVKFIYFPAELNGHAVGVIRIPVQPRPCFLKRDYGKLKANTVYIRRGSSTTIASPDEIAQMGAAGASLTNNDLLVRFSKSLSREFIGPAIELNCVNVQMSEGNDIPDFDPDQPGGIYSIVDPKPNPDFFRDLVERFQDAKLLREVAVTISNLGTLTARDIRVEFAAADSRRDWEFRDPTSINSDPPQRYTDRLGISAAAMRVSARRGLPNYDFRHIDGTWHLTFEFGNLQPGRTLWPALEFLVGARKTGAILFDGKIMADGLAAPINCELEIKATTEEILLGLDDLVRLFDKHNEAEQG